MHSHGDAKRSPRQQICLEGGIFSGDLGGKWIKKNWRVEKKESWQFPSGFSIHTPWFTLYCGLVEVEDKC